MRRTTTAALAAAATTLSLVLLPGTAHAAETITPAEAVADVHAVAAATATAVGTTGFTEWSTSANAEDWAFAYDPVRHVREERLKYRTDTTAVYVMNGVATYVPIVRNALTRAGLVIAGKPAATWEYYLVPRTEADLSRLAHDDLLDPVTAPDPAKPYLTVVSAATRTVSPDGSTQWALTGVDGAGNQVDYTVSSDTTGRLASMHIVRTNARGSFVDDEHITYAKPAIPVLTRADVIPGRRWRSRATASVCGRAWRRSSSRRRPARPHTPRRCTAGCGRATSAGTRSTTSSAPTP